MGGGGGSFSRCPCGQGVGGKQNVHPCPLGVGGWFTKGKNMSKWLLNAPSAYYESALDPSYNRNSIKMAYKHESSLVDDKGRGICLFSNVNYDVGYHLLKCETLLHI